MKTIQLLSILITFSFSASNTYADAEGGETTTNLIWACYSLVSTAPLPPNAIKKSGCFAYSPTSFYQEMELIVQISGESAQATNCENTSDYSDSKVDAYDEPTTNVLKREWGFPAGGSWDDEINASGTWELVSGPTGSDIVGPYNNTHPPCY